MASNSLSFAQLEVRVILFGLRANRLQVLLACSNFDPAVCWELPGAPVLPHQSLDETASLCLTRFSGVKEAYLEQLYTFGDLRRSSSGRVVSVAYFGLIPAGTPPTLIDDSKAQWFPVDELPGMAADHGEIVRYGLRRLRYKLEYTAVGFQLLPETFSLSELQLTYEQILGEKLDKRNFRRRILEAGIIEPTVHQRMGEGRPARLYCFRPGAVAEVKARRLFP
jgi:8-oxo-dGTP diphosphatase